MLGDNGLQRAVCTFRGPGVPVPPLITIAPRPPGDKGAQHAMRMQIFRLVSEDGPVWLILDSCILGHDVQTEVPVEVGGKQDDPNWLLAFDAGRLHTLTC